MAPAFVSEEAVVGRGVTLGHGVVVHAGVVLSDGCRVLDGAVLGRLPMTAGNTNRPLKPLDRPLTVGEDSVIGAGTVLYAGSTLGARVLVGDLASLREGCTLGDDAVVGRGVLVMYDAVIGERSRVIDGAILTGGILIEPDVFVGPGVTTINDNDVYLKRFGLLPFDVRGPILRRFCLVGAGANLAAGVEVGTGAVVAPSAMVTRDVPPWTVVAGVPARTVRLVDAEDRDRILARFGLLELREAS